MMVWVCVLEKKSSNRSFFLTNKWFIFTFSPFTASVWCPPVTQRRDIFPQTCLLLSSFPFVCPNKSPPALLLMMLMLERMLSMLHLNYRTRRGRKKITAQKSDAGIVHEIWAWVFPHFYAPRVKGGRGWREKEGETGAWLVVAKQPNWHPTVSHRRIFS